MKKCASFLFDLDKDIDVWDMPPLGLDVEVDEDEARCRPQTAPRGLVGNVGVCHKPKLT